tara:strand:+ start:4659 stop:6290 length:1632 start_codon:yes stop_codon:yes gene_type:complete
MLSELIKICKIIPYTAEDEDYISVNYKNFALEVYRPEILKESFIIPTLIIGWENVKKHYPEQSILNSKITDKLYWTYSLSENESKSKSDIESFLNFSIKKFFNKNLITYDAIIDGEFRDFILNNINPKIRSFIYFHKDACYIYNDKNTYAISILSLKFIGKDYKKILTSLINKIECTILSYYNVSRYVYMDELRDVMTTENIFWSKYSYNIEPKDFSNMFLGKDMHKNIPLLMKITRENNEITNDELNSCKRQTKKDKITSWLSGNKIYFDKNFKPQNGLKCSWDNGKKYLILRYSDKRTITGRINCIDGFNPQMLPKDSNIREQIISRYEGGKIAVFDYRSFEARLSMYLSRDEEFILKNMNSDLHLNTAKSIFQKDELSDEERKLGKDINHALLYGGGDALLKNIISKSNVEDLDGSISRVKDFLQPILNVSSYINDVYKELGYIINPFGTLIKPNKSYAAFNNYVQSTAADIVVDKISEVKNWLKDKESSFMFQVHDSFVLDVSPKDLNAIEEIKSILSKYNDMAFDIEVLSGGNYMECN